MGQRLKCRIHQFFPDSLLMKLDKLCKNKLISDNNKKVSIILDEILPQYDLNFRVLGPGTNRLAILVDGYAFKIAVDHLGVQDNWAEFALCKELYPYVTKVYECNGLIAVHEYVKVMSKTEFMNRQSEIANILSNFAPDWLIGDVGTIAKNYLNWGMRDDDEPVILDFAYFYHINWADVHCDFVHQNGTVCDGDYRYNKNYSYLVCNRCGHKATFTEILGRLSSNYELENIQLSKKGATKVTRNVTEVEANKTITTSSLGYTDPLPVRPEFDDFWYSEEGEIDMSNNDFLSGQEMTIDEAYERALAFAASMCSNPEQKTVEELNNDEDYALETELEQDDDVSDISDQTDEDFEVDVLPGQINFVMDADLPESDSDDEPVSPSGDEQIQVNPTQTENPVQDEQPSVTSFVKVIKPTSISEDKRAELIQELCE